MLGPLPLSPTLSRKGRGGKQTKFTLTLIG